MVCARLDFCTNSTCQLWPSPTSPLPSSFHLPAARARVVSAQGTQRARLAHKISILADAKSSEAAKPGKIQETPWQWIEDLLNRMNQHHEPIVDFDHDNYSGNFFLFLFNRISLSFFLFGVYLICMVFIPII